MLHEATNRELLKEYYRKVKILLCYHFIIILECDVHVCQISYTKYNLEDTLFYIILLVFIIPIYTYTYIYMYIYID